jgi:signal transduction histidine kinase
VYPSGKKNAGQIALGCSALLQDDETIRKLIDTIAHVSERAERLIREAPEGLPPVYLDRDRILQVLSNLIGNAIKFTPPGGRIAVATVKSGREARFSVTDTGAGIAPEHLERIFDRFYTGGAKADAEIGARANPSRARREVCFVAVIPRRRLKR